MSSPAASEPASAFIDFALKLYYDGGQ